MKKNKEKSSPEQCDVLICGAGAPGLTLALLLGKIGISVKIIDPSSLTVLRNGTPDTRTVALMNGSIDIFKFAGVWQECAVNGGIMKSLKIIDDSSKGGTPVEAAFHASDIGQDIFSINMPSRILRAALTESILKSKHAQIIPETKFLSCEADDFGVTAKISCGEIRAKLIIGADGRDSAVRQCSGIDVWEHDYGQSALTCLIRHSLPHDETSTEFHRPTGPFALVPLPGKFSSVVWVDKTKAVKEYLKINKKAFEAALQDRSRNLLGTIDLTMEPQSFPLKALKAKRITARRVAIMAEAAHVLHPLTAQGLNLSMRDVASLADVISDASRLGLDIGSSATLSRYESRRRSDIALRVHGTDVLNRFVSQNRTSLHALRRAGLKTIDHFPFLKEFVMQQGMAPEGRRLNI